MAELVGRYSNPNECGRLADIIKALAEHPAWAEARDDAGPLPGSHRRWRTVDRIGDQAIRDLLRASRLGTTKRAFAERFSISISSVKRLLRRVDEDHHDISAEGPITRRQ